MFSTNLKSIYLCWNFLFICLQTTAQTTSTGWSEIPNPSSSPINSLITSGNVLIAGGDGVYSSSDNGQSWTAINPAPSGINDLLLLDGKILAATNNGAMEV